MTSLLPLAAALTVSLSTAPPATGQPPGHSVPSEQSSTSSAALDMRLGPSDAAAPLDLGATPAVAQVQSDIDGDLGAYGPEQGDWEFTLTGSGVSDQDFDVNSVGATFSIGYYFTEALELSLRQSINLLEDDGTNFSGSTRVALDFHFDLDRFRPFVGANFGGVYGEEVDETFAAGVEGGLKWYAKEDTFIFGMIEYQWFFDEAGGADDNFDDGQFVYTLGVGFNF